MSDEIYTKIRAIEKVLSDVREDAVRFDRGNVLAGTRITKNIQKIKKQVQEARVRVFAIKKERKKK